MIGKSLYFGDPLSFGVVRGHLRRMKNITAGDQQVQGQSLGRFFPWQHVRWYLYCYYLALYAHFPLS